MKTLTDPKLLNCSVVNDQLLADSSSMKNR